MTERNGIGGSMQSVTGSKNVLYTNDIKFEEGSWWNRRSGLEKKLVFLLVLLLIVALVLFVVLIVLATQRNFDTQSRVEMTTAEPLKQEVCLTPGCVTAAARILDYADLTANPCEDFYQYACGSFMRKKDIAEDRSSNDIFYELDDELNIKLRDVIESSSTDSEPESTQYARNLYQSCLNKEELEQRGIQPLLDFLPKIGGWPLLDPSWDESTFHLETTLANLSLLNQAPLIYMGVRNDMADSNVYRIYFDQPGLGMPSRDYLLAGRNDTKLLAYEKLANQVAIALGADPTVAKAQIADIIDFEIQIANITVPKADRQDPSEMYNLITLRDMALNYSDFDWMKYMKIHTDQPQIDINVTEDEVVVNWSPSYFEQLFPVLRNTPKRVVANYLGWMMVKSMVTTLSQNFRDMMLEYNEVLYGVSSDPPRWKSCLGYVNRVMSMSVARLFTDKYFDEQAKLTMLDLIANLREAFNQLLLDVDWMDEATRLVAEEKAGAMNEKIGYPDAIKNNTYVDDLYKEYYFNASTYFENVATVQGVSSRRNLRLLRDRVDKTKWIVQPAIVNAFYYGSWNEIVFPAGILQAPFYSEYQPWSLNFGGIGSVIGHEITHGFDNRGRQTDKDGNLRDWWDADVVERFNNKTQCFIDQTSQFVVPEVGENVNGRLTVSEDIADNGGVKQSFKAYRNFIAKRGSEEPLLPGVSLNHNQLFFMSWSQVWCAKTRPDFAKYLILNDYHSPNRYRAVGPLMNSPEFAEAFQCKSGSAMNPSDKCALW